MSAAMLSLLQAQTPLFVALLNQHWPCARALLVGFDNMY
jgi:hypothetical protein